MTSELLPQDAVALPLELTPLASDEPTLIATGLAARPELKESQALVAAACEAYKREKYAPFVPSVLLGFSSTSFGGGIGRDAENFAGRYDIDAMMVWEMRTWGSAKRSSSRTQRADTASYLHKAAYDGSGRSGSRRGEHPSRHSQATDRLGTVCNRSGSRFLPTQCRSYSRSQRVADRSLAIHSSPRGSRACLPALRFGLQPRSLQLQWALGWTVMQLPKGELCVRPE